MPLYAWIALYGGFTATIYPLCIAYANDYLEPGQIVAASGSLVFAFSLGAATGPSLAAIVMGHAGPNGLFLLSVTICLGFVAFILYRMRIRHWAPVVEKESYVPMPEVSATPVTTEIDPRAEVGEEYDHTEAPTGGEPIYAGR